MASPHACDLLVHRTADDSIEAECAAVDDDPDRLRWVNRVAAQYWVAINYPQGANSDVVIEIRYGSDFGVVHHVLYAGGSVHQRQRRVTIDFRAGFARECGHAIDYGRSNEIKGIVVSHAVVVKLAV